MAISKSTALTSIIVAIFVIAVVAGLFLTYTSNTNNQPSFSVSQITLQSGTASTSSLNKTCSGDSELDIYVSNTLSTTIYLKNVTIFGSSLSQNGTTLVTVSSGCLPVDESNPVIASGSNDFLIASYPDIPLPLGTLCNVEIEFSNGQNLTEALIAQAT